MPPYTNYTIERYSGNAAIILAFAPDINIVLSQVRLHLSAVGVAVEDFTVTLDSASGVEYDANLLTQPMAAVEDVVWIPDNPITIQRGDILNVAYTNTNALTWGLEIIYRKET